VTSAVLAASSVLTALLNMTYPQPCEEAVCNWLSAAEYATLRGF
jgi:hypothetical protein